MKADYIFTFLFLYFWCTGYSGCWKDDAIQVEEIPAGAAHVCTGEPACTVSQVHRKGETAHTYKTSYKYCTFSSAYTTALLNFKI